WWQPPCGRRVGSSAAGARPSSLRSGWARWRTTECRSGRG
ncbi:MAG: hypothetical protein AVDCRST_MAG57-1237, partial [uncultured Blastococcus sp.]